MSVTTILSEGLSLLTYNRDHLTTPKNSQLNIYMGIGLWSKENRLSEGLPIDVMQMLLAATLMRSQIVEANQGKSSKIIVLIADSMAIREGADREKVVQLVEIYKRSLEPLLDLLNLTQSSELLLSSELEVDKQYQKTHKAVENLSLVQRLKVEDEEHYPYLCTQTAITHYMNQSRDVGIKVGWLAPNSIKNLHECIASQSLKGWDELKFDRFYVELYESSTMQYLYTKPGLKQSRNKKSYRCPHTAYAKDHRFVIQTIKKKNYPLTNKISHHWKGVAEVCVKLAQARITTRILLPAKCIEENENATVSNLLNYWVNFPASKERRILALFEFGLRHDGRI